MTLKKTILGLTLAVIGFSGLSQAQAKSPYPYSLKNYDKPSKGCYPVSRVSLTEARDIIRLQKLKLVGAGPIETRTLGAALTWMHYLNGDEPLRSATWKRRDPYQIRIVSGNGSSGQRWDHILIRRNGHKQHGESVAQHVHELAHLIGNNGSYQLYRNHMKGYGYCLVSGYSDNRFNEQFAEVFTAFVTEPALLTKNSSTPKACKRAFDFFESWFDAGNRVQECL
ncbi:MAG: hypothetical protein CME63_12190 [Halobacteriovoraceae bacterium]|nr:hypothetical protein [Halobacteriovoraceae bacterium]MBC98502.1 hypothetical protein [Halobacteriovoraceae bacterium]|tara:strand:+ start:7843 stop:8517 length:675 start_codon:yes stop_codon:yes gene_type:complete